MDSLKLIKGFDAPKISKYINSLHSIITHVSYNVFMLTMTYEYKLPDVSEKAPVFQAGGGR